jgi:hypothetical protein
MGNFLDDLKKAVDDGEFNSEAAKKINKIDELADEKTNPEGRLNERLEKAGVKNTTEEAVVEANVNYEIEMAEMKRKDEINRLLATLIEIEDMVKLSIGDMFSHINELDSKFKNEFENKDPLFGDLSQKVEEIKSKYNNIINH